jgi:hypothetical protein
MGARSWSLNVGNIQKSQHGGTIVQEVLHSELSSAIEARFDLTRGQSYRLHIISSMDQTPIALYLHFK